MAAEQVDIAPQGAEAGLAPVAVNAGVPKPEADASTQAGHMITICVSIIPVIVIDIITQFVIIVIILRCGCGSYAECRSMTRSFVFVCGSAIWYVGLMMMMMMMMMTAK